MWTALLVSALLGVASVLVPVSRPAVAVQAGVMEKGPELQRPDVVSAGVTARAAGQRVEITGHRTEFSRSYMNTDGSISVSEHAGQQRFKNSAGGWVEVDLDLAVGEDGVVAPKAHPLDLRVAGGGEKDAALVSVTAGIDTQGSDRRISWTWPGVLPTPVLDGSTATYEDVTPGVDMRVVATRSGFEQFFEITSRATVPAAGGLSWAMPITATGGLTVRADADGGTSFIDGEADAGDAVVSRIPPPIAWDRNVDQTRGARDAVAPVKLTVEEATGEKAAGLAVLTVAPDSDWLREPDRAFPVTVDPSYVAASVNPSFDTFVQTGFASDQSGQPELKTGTYDGGSTKARSFVRFPTTGVSGKLIQSASLSLYETWSYSCTPRAVDAWSVTTDATTATRWTAQPGLVSKVGSVSAAKGYSSSCPAGRIDIPVTSLVQWWSGASPVMGMPTGSAVLGSGQTLTGGQSLASPDGRFYASLQGDGNFVVYGPAGARWSTGTQGNPGARVVMQGDGNLVVYSPGGAALWNSGTVGKLGSTLSMQSDGNLVIRQGSTAVWNIGAAPATPPGTIAVVAGSETDSLGWKRFASMESAQDPVLEYTYTRAPGIVSGPTLAVGGAWSGIDYAPTTTPQYSLAVTDPDTNTVRAAVEVWTNVAGAPGTRTSS